MYVYVILIQCNSKCSHSHTHIHLSVCRQCKITKKKYKMRICKQYVIIKIYNNVVNRNYKKINIKNKIRKKKNDDKKI